VCSSDLYNILLNKKNEAIVTSKEEMESQLKINKE
jgi:hypothetical protein